MLQVFYIEYTTLTHLENKTRVYKDKRSKNARFHIPFPHFLSNKPPGIHNTHTNTHARTPARLPFLEGILGATLAPLQLQALSAAWRKWPGGVHVHSCILQEDCAAHHALNQPDTGPCKTFSGASFPLALQAHLLVGIRWQVGLVQQLRGEGSPLSPLTHSLIGYLRHQQQTIFPHITDR